MPGKRSRRFTSSNTAGAFHVRVAPEIRTTPTPPTAQPRPGMPHKSGNNAARSDRARRPGEAGGEEGGEESAQDRQHRGPLRQPSRRRGPAARGSRRPSAPSALHVIDLDAGPAPEVVDAIAVNQPLLAYPAGLNRSHGRLLAIDMAELWEGEPCGWEGSPPTQGSRNPEEAQASSGCPTGSLDVDDEAQETKNLAIPLLDEPRPGDGPIDVPDPVIAGLSDIQAPVPERGPSRSRGGSGRCHGDAPIHAVEDRDVLDRSPAASTHARFREEAIHDPRTEGLLVVLRDFDPCHLDHVGARLVERGRRATDPVPGEIDIRTERRPPGTRGRNPGRERVQ